MVTNLLQIIIRYLQKLLKVFIPFRIFVYKMLLISELIYSISINAHNKHLKISIIRSQQQ
jgi:hypothetical protein